ncbi:GNAT family N-acetyltransferase [Celerinatantimonas sp. MCCC 1A17872]|uniref:GNAT family N-acetyltransferase n=1 Tax=Celerinatantimonas sp. MCCC 1A17872 TaxID=3177514 RepID=UPI0038CA0D0F
MLLESEQVRFRSLELADAPVFVRWSENRLVTQYSLSQFNWPHSLQDIKNWLSGINQNHQSFHVGICCKKTGELIGYAGITQMSMINRSAEFFILIGEQRYWSRGIGSEVARLVTEYGFQRFNLNRIFLTAYSNNIQAIKAYENAGFIHEGVLRQAGFRQGQYLDKVMMSALAKDARHKT